MSCSKKLALAGDVLFYLKRSGIDIDYEEAIDLAGSLLSDGGWDITFRAGPHNECCDRDAVGAKL